MDRAEFIEDTASQRLYFTAPEGRPSATPTVGTADQGGSVLTAAADTYVTQDTVATTIANSAAAGAKSLVLTSSTGVTVGRRYRVTNKYGEHTEVEVEKTNGATVYFKGELEFACDLLSTTYGDFESCDFYYTLQSDDYDTLRDLAVATATYTVGGLTYVQRLAFDIVTCPLPNILTAGRIYDRFGLDLARQEPDETRGEDYDKQRDAAWSIVKRRVLQHSDTSDQWRPAMIVDASDLFEYGCAVFARLCHEQGIKVLRNEPTAETLIKAEEIERELAFASISWLDKGDDGSRGEEDIQPIEPDFIR